MTHGALWNENEIDFLRKNYRTMTHKEIGRQLGRSEITVKARCHILGLKKRDAIFDRTPSPNLAYVLGVCLGDGSVCKSKKKHHYSIYLGNMDKEFVTSFKEALIAIGLNAYRVSQNNRGVWQVSAENKSFYEWYHGLNYDDTRRLLVNTEAKREFIRGFYESEGSFVRKGHRWQLKIHNCNLELLNFVREITENLGFHALIDNGRISRFKGGTPFTEYTMRLLGGASTIVRFLREINPCIPQKSLEKIDFNDTRGLEQPHKFWTKEEEQFMKENYPRKDMTVKKICEKLNRSKASVCGKAKSMGLNKFTIPSRRHFT